MTAVTPSRPLLPDLFIIGHGVLMIVSLFVLTTLTIFLRRILAYETRPPKLRKQTGSRLTQFLVYLSNHLPLWLPREFEDAHLLIQGSGVILMLAGFNLAVFASDQHFVSIHSWLGMVVFLGFGIFLPFTGMLDVSYEEATQRKFTNWHRKYGRILWQASFPVAALGFVQLYRWFQ